MDMFVRTPRVGHNSPGYGLYVFLTGFLFFCLLSGQAAFGKEESTGKTAVVLATFGSTVANTEHSLAALRQELAARFPERPLFVAYTSEHVFRILRERGENVMNLNQRLADLSAQGYDEVVVQSLHVTPGKEFAGLQTLAAMYSSLPKGAMDIQVGPPLLGSHTGAEALAEVLTRSLPPERQKNEAVIFVGHGAESAEGSLAYPALQAFLQQRDQGLYVGTIEGPYSPEYLLGLMRARKVTRVWLVPLLTVVGDHARNDIFGPEENSWAQTFTRAGLQVRTVERGLLDVPGVVELLADHVANTLDLLEDRGTYGR